MTAVNLNHLLEAFGNQGQDLEDALWTILLDTYLDVATGINLDRLGGIGRTGSGRVITIPLFAKRSESGF